MERATKVTVVETTPPVPTRRVAKQPEPSLVEEQKKALKISPDSLVADNSYPKETYELSLKSAKAAAYVVNSGKRKSWPNDEYYAIWRVRPDTVTTDSDGEEVKVVQILIGKRSHIKPEWEPIVGRAGSRKASSSESDTDDPSED